MPPIDQERKTPPHSRAQGNGTGKNPDTKEGLWGRLPWDAAMEEWRQTSLRMTVGRRDDLKRSLKTLWETKPFTSESMEA